MLQALLERQVVPDLVVGCSVGSLNGAFIAANPSLTRVDTMIDTWSSISDRGLLTGSFFGRLGRLVRGGTYVHSNDGLRALIEGGLGVSNFEDLPVHFECVAACIERAAGHWFSSGPVADAVLASCAVPGLLPAVEIDGEHFYDGGLVSSVPVGRAVGLGARQIFVLHVGRLEQPLRAPSTPWQVGLVAFEIARRHQFQEDLAKVPGGVDVHVLPSGSQAPPVAVRYRHPSGIPARITAAHAAASAYLDHVFTGAAHRADDAD